MAVDVQMSKMRATAPPCSEPDILHMPRGITILNIVRELCGFDGVGSKVASSSFRCFGRSESWPCRRTG